MLTLRPTHDVVYIKRNEPDTKANHGVLLAPTKLTDNTGKVIAVGPGKTYSDGKIKPLTVKVGDEVIFSKYAGQTYKIDGQEMIALREDDIYAILS